MSAATSIDSHTGESFICLEPELVRLELRDGVVDGESHLNCTNSGSYGPRN